MPVRIIATCFAFVAFATALVCGLTAGNPTGTIITRAIVAMVVCYIVGFILGTLGRHAIQEHVDQYKKDHPVRPSEDEVVDEVIDEPDGAGRSATEKTVSSNAA